MINIQDLKVAFNEKLAKTGSMDAAFTKAVWLAYKQGHAEGSKEVQLVDWDEGRIDIIGQNGNDGQHYMEKVYAECVDPNN